MFWGRTVCGLAAWKTNVLRMNFPNPTVQCFIVYLRVMVQENSRPDDVTSTCLIPEFRQKLKTHLSR